LNLRTGQIEKRAIQKELSGKITNFSMRMERYRKNAARPALILILVRPTMIDEANSKKVREQAGPISKQVQHACHDPCGGLSLSRYRSQAS
jgi:hypothetical protein